VEWQAPVYAGYTIEGSSIRIHFDNVGEGLAFANGTVLQGFAITSGSSYYWANAVIDDATDTVVVSNPNISNPTAVAYSWYPGLFPWANLFGKNGLPVQTFATYDFTDGVGTQDAVGLHCHLSANGKDLYYLDTPVVLTADPGGITDVEVSKVEFFNGVTKIGEVTSAPFVFSWTDAPVGHHTITAKVTDTSARTATSGSVRAYVRSRFSANISAAGNTVTLTWPSVEGQLYNVYSRDSLTQENFLLIEERVTATAPTNTLELPLENGKAMQFYDIEAYTPDLP